MNFDAFLKLTKNHKVTVEELSKFPEVRRDLALLVDTQVTFSQLREIAFSVEKKLLKRMLPSLMFTKVTNYPQVRSLTH